jgi:hypothetical protein
LDTIKIADYFSLLISAGVVFLEIYLQEVFILKQTQARNAENASEKPQNRVEQYLGKEALN